MKLSQKIVDALVLPEGKNEIFAWDDDVPGLAARIQGKRGTWIVQYRVARRSRRVTLGPLAGISLKEARARASRILADSKDGKDAQAERQATRAKTAQSFGRLVEIYLERYARPNQRPRTLLETERYLAKAWAPFHERGADSVTRFDVADRLAELVKESGGIAANRARARLSALFSWAMRQGIVDGNPCVAVDPPAQERASDRVLAAEELELVWRTADPSDDYGAIVRLLMLTGQRREEVGGMRWGELDLNAGLWVIPASRTKNKRVHEVPLSRQAVAILAAVKRREGRELVFGRGEGGFSGWSRCKDRLDATIALTIAEAAGKKKATAQDALPRWVLHDLRRTAVTGMAEMGVEPHVVEAVVNHVSGHKAGVAGVYNRASYRAQKRAALQAWADWIEQQVGGSDG